MYNPTAETGWVSTPASCPVEVFEQVRSLLCQIHYCTLSTCTADGIPWVSPVFYAHQGLKLYWSSAIASQHSQNLATNQGQVAIAIYNSQVAEGTAQGLYLSGLAKELDSDRTQAAMERLFARAGGEPPQRTAADYLGESPRRMYQFVPQAVWITGDRVVVGRQLVDTKIRLNLEKLTAWMDE